MSAVPVIAVDGPSGVGKGMVTRWLSQRLGWHRLDSGALYRILALAARRMGMSLDDAPSVAAIAPTLDIRFGGATEEDESVLVDGEDWTRAVRAEESGALASRIAASSQVRAALLRRQRAFRQAPGLVADGRDMGTVVFPDARLKIFLDATPEERAVRRQEQLRQAGVSANISRLCEDIRARDERDRNRAVAPLRPATDAQILDTSGLSAEAVRQKVELLLQRHGL